MPSQSSAGTLGFHILYLFFQAEVVAGFAAQAFAVGASAFEGVEREVAGGEVTEDFAGAGVSVGGLEGQLAVVLLPGSHEKDFGLGSAEAEG